MASRMRFKQFIVSFARRARSAVLGHSGLRSPQRAARSVLRAVLVFVAISACTHAAPPPDRKPEQGFSNAFAMRGCTQEDVPAMEIYLTQSPYTGVGRPSLPYIRIEISSSPEERIASVTLHLIQLRRDPTNRSRIARAELVEFGHASTWLSGTVELSDATPGEKVVGRYNVMAPDGGRYKSDFVTEYSRRAAVCG
jgi:hypothetical protein